MKHFRKFLLEDTDIEVGNVEDVPKGTTPVDVVSGRFQPVHNGHVNIIKQMNNSPVVIIVRGKESSKNKDDNPFPESYQKKLWNMYDKKVLVYVADGAYLKDIFMFLRTKGLEPATYFAGPDRINSYVQQYNRFNNKLEDEYKFDVKFKETQRMGSASQVRKALLDNDKEAFKALVPTKLWGEFDKMTKIINPQQSQKNPNAKYQYNKEIGEENENSARFL